VPRRRRRGGGGGGVGKSQTRKGPVLYRNCNWQYGTARHGFFGAPFRSLVGWLVRSFARSTMTPLSGSPATNTKRGFTTRTTQLSLSLSPPNAGGRLERRRPFRTDDDGPSVRSGSHGGSSRATRRRLRPEATRTRKTKRRRRCCRGCRSVGPYRTVPFDSIPFHFPSIPSLREIAFQGFEESSSSTSTTGDDGRILHLLRRSSLVRSSPQSSVVVIFVPARSVRGCSPPSPLLSATSNKSNEKMACKSDRPGRHEAGGTELAGAVVLVLVAPVPTTAAATATTTTRVRRASSRADRRSADDRQTIGRR